MKDNCGCLFTFGIREINLRRNVVAPLHFAGETGVRETGSNPDGRLIFFFIKSSRIFKAVDKIIYCLKNIRKNKDTILAFRLMEYERCRPLRAPGTWEDNRHSRLLSAINGISEALHESVMHL